MVKKSDTGTTPQPLYNTIVGVHANFRVSYPICVISRVKCICYIGKGVLNSHLGAKTKLLLYPKPCYNEPCYKEVQVYYYTD